jgi:hypothetical protein
VEAALDGVQPHLQRAVIDDVLLPMIHRTIAPTLAETQEHDANDVEVNFYQLIAHRAPREVVRNVIYAMYDEAAEKAKSRDGGGAATSVRLAAGKAKVGAGLKLYDELHFDLEALPVKTAGQLRRTEQVVKHIDGVTTSMADDAAAKLKRAALQAVDTRADASKVTSSHISAMTSFATAIADAFTQSTPAAPGGAAAADANAAALWDCAMCGCVAGQPLTVDLIMHKPPYADRFPLPPSAPAAPQQVSVSCAVKATQAKVADFASAHAGPCHCADYNSTVRRLLARSVSVAADFVKQHLDEDAAAK